MTNHPLHSPPAGSESGRCRDSQGECTCSHDYPHRAPGGCTYPACTCGHWQRQEIVAAGRGAWISGPCVTLCAECGDPVRDASRTRHPECEPAEAPRGTGQPDAPR